MRATRFVADIPKCRSRRWRGRAGVLTLVTVSVSLILTAFGSPLVVASDPAVNAPSPSAAINDSGSIDSASEQLEQYGISSTGVALRWTAFEPTGTGPHPAVLVLHAGGFKTGVAGPDSVSQDLAAAGFFALSTEYRLAPLHENMNTPDHPPPSQNTVVPVDDGHYPEQTTDVQMAIRAARRDPRCNGLVYCVGGSAGASHSVYMAATGTAGDDMPDLIVCLSGPYDFADLGHLQTPCLPDETCFWEALINYLGVPDYIHHLPELEAASPITYVTQNFPPAYIMVSSNDASQLAIHDFPQLLAKLNSVGITESIASYPEKGHYKQWVVPVGPIVQHAFEYWAKARMSVIDWLQAGPPTTSLPAVTLLVTDDSASEVPVSNTGSVKITRTGPATSALTVFYTLTGTATNGSDYRTLRGQAIIKTGASSVEVIVRPIDDRNPEPDETVIFTLLPNVSYTIGSPNSGTVVIHSNE